MKLCRHDVKIKFLLTLFEPMSKKDIYKETRIAYKKINKLLEEFQERKLVQELKRSDGTILYHTTPKGKKLVNHFKYLMDHLEGKEMFPHIFRSYKKY